MAPRKTVIKHVSIETSALVSELMRKHLSEELSKYDTVGNAKLLFIDGIKDPVWVSELTKGNSTDYLIYETCACYIYIAPLMTPRYQDTSTFLSEKKDTDGKVVKRGRIFNRKFELVMRWEFY